MDRLAEIEAYLEVAFWITAADADRLEWLIAEVKRQRELVEYWRVEADRYFSVISNDPCTASTSAPSYEHIRAENERLREAVEAVRAWALTPNDDVEANQILLDIFDKVSGASRA